MFQSVKFVSTVPILCLVFGTIDIFSHVFFHYFLLQFILIMASILLLLTPHGKMLAQARKQCIFLASFV